MANESENVFAREGEKEVPDTRTERQKLMDEEQNTLKYLSPAEQEEFLGLVEKYEKENPNVFAEIEDKPKDVGFSRIEELREKANKAWQDTPEYKNAVEGQK